MKLTDIIGYKIIEFINDQIKQGYDIDGKKYSYSTNPFWMPYSKKVVQKFGKKQQGKLYKITNRGGKLGLIILGGYKSYREKFNRATDSDFLQFTGNLLSSIDIINSDGNSVEVGFNNKKAMELAYYMNVSGVGRSRKLWKFFGLSKENLEKLLKIEDVPPAALESLVKAYFQGEIKINN